MCLMLLTWQRQINYEAKNNSATSVEKLRVFNSFTSAIKVRFKNLKVKNEAI